MWWWKVGFPTVWFGTITIATIRTVFRMVESGRLQYEIFLGVIILLILGYVVMRYTIGDMVDKAWLKEKYLTVKKDGQTVDVPYHNIEKIVYNRHSRPPSVVLTLSYESEVGEDIAFVPRWDGRFFQKENLFVSELIGKVDSKHVFVK